MAITTQTSSVGVKTSVVHLASSALEFMGAVPFGSRALNVHNTRSDYDYVILKSVFSTYIESNPDFEYRTITTDLSNYFKIAPKTGDNLHIRFRSNQEYDLLLLENSSDIEIVKQAVENLNNKHSKMKLKNKKFRVAAYQQELLTLGWKDTENISLFSKLWKTIKEHYKGSQ